MKIGDQWWMAENPAYLTKVSPSSDGTYTEPYYYVIGYEGTNVETTKATDNYNKYGVLYNWLAAKAACPPGWHLPSDTEWTELANYFGGEYNAGRQMKESGTVHWISPNEGATNESGFSGLPGGSNSGGSFYDIGKEGYFWSATEFNTTVSRFRRLGYNSVFFRSLGYPKDCGFSVRYVKD